MWLWSLLLACSSGPTPAAFVRGGVIVDGGAEGRALADGRRFVARAWTPGERVGEAVAPVVPECAPLFAVDLGDVSRGVAAGGAQPDTALAFSPDGERLAVGTARGELWLLDAWTGAVLARRRLADALVKRVAFSPDGAVVYAGEQSPDALLLALDAADLSTRWSLRLADRVGTSALPPADDLFGVYTLPGVYGLHVLADGALLVSAVHAHDPAEGVRENASQVLVVGPDGAVRAAWPGSPASATFLHPVVAADGASVAVQVGRSATGPAPDLPIGGVQRLSLPGLAPLAATRLDPLAPHFVDVFLWEATALVGEALVIGATDGRVVGAGADGAVGWTRALGTPVVAADVPVAAPIGHAVAVAGGVAVAVGGSNVPSAATTAAAEPPAPHPEAHSLHVLDPATGETRWAWRGPVGLGGLAASPDGATLAVATARRPERPADEGAVLVFRAEGEGTGAERLLTTCAAAGPLFFRPAVAADGRVAAVEIPWRADGGGVSGRYRALVFR